MEPGAASTFTYTRDLSVTGSGGGFLGAFFKIPLALLSVRYAEEEVGAIRVTSAPTGAAVGAPVDFADAAPRGPARSHVAQPGTRRRAAQPALIARTRDDELGDEAAPAPARRVWLWTAVGVTVAAIAAAVGLAIGGVI
ncbi:MAG TPA: hypothetical protein PLL22_03855, partial [Microbacteriaceae bacterium]|nr:hypothetical protein [Microbacteriaceae bacterium]